MGRDLNSLIEGMPIPFGGNKITYVSPELAEAFVEGDRIIVVQTTGELLHIPASVWEVSQNAVESAHTAFSQMGSVTDEAISAFYGCFADQLANEDSFHHIQEANSHDVNEAMSKEKSTTRLILSSSMRESMIDGLRMWSSASSNRGETTEEIPHNGWTINQVTAGLGIVGFVFEGRPNVFADATGVLRSGNTVVFRIGSDALHTANAIAEHALTPALIKAGLPIGAVSLVNSPSRAAGYAIFSDERLSLAVARGSGPAVAQLGAVARQAGTPVSLHGTGGAWIVAGQTADPERFRSAIFHSLDRKVCNTLNTCCIPKNRADDLVPVFLEALKQAGQRRGAKSKLHVVESSSEYIPDVWFQETNIDRAEGTVTERQTDIIGMDELAHEWEWENSPEVSLVIVESTEHAIDLFNNHSPQFIASLISENESEHKQFFESVNAPFVGNGFTRWVDGQYALGRPELGLSNWQFGRLFGRGGVLSGDSVVTTRTKNIQTDPNVTRIS
ncbi:MAG: aldehyde dehydrogenase family protein [Acidimicrobiales bacterium]|nr:aldehyde dehydrogenase family protein [Acidimicrobiales bacterium]